MCMCSIIPPGMLDSIARRGTRAQREWALDTLSKDGSLRTARLQAGLLSGGLYRPSPLAHEKTGRPHRVIRDAQGKEDFGGPVVREEGGRSRGDAAVDEAYEGFGATYGFFWKVFDRDSIDDEGVHLLGIVHFGARYANAFWDGQRMVFGDGDGDLFNRFTAAVDVIGHELVHGITEDEAGLAYVGQSGALNESISDVFGAMVKQYVLKQTAEQADWLIGGGLFTSKVKGRALRSMKAPGTAYDDKVLGKDPQPVHMRDYVQTTADNGGVHINSGIPNLAFYSVAAALGGYAWERAGRIWYETLRAERLKPSSSFIAFARLTLNAAKRLYGANGEEANAVADGWNRVGIRLRAS